MKKMLPWMITILLAITLIAVAAVYLFNQFFNPSPGSQTASTDSSMAAKPLSADKRVELTAELADIQTNLADPNTIIVLGVAFQMNTAKAKEEFDKIKEIQIRPIIVRTLSDLTEEELKGSAGKDALAAQLINLINPVLPEGGKVTNVAFTNYIVTPL
ncbi:flagellar basal body-associated FliL family protein [Paenibacillus sp. IB182496]|uniref:Flagellar protein FliL n=1 Tax=Paenibacillus sabuli TaxID=2772509 RepID=A0A927GRS2_9BACL|nr:flagellar basal body-associated FliL family protein [Paenibacillus sabuli]MBD2845280.1 flagellar basal body-associated FliL family protein [Paenibacillus sabuli]